MHCVHVHAKLFARFGRLGGGRGALSILGSQTRGARILGLMAASVESEAYFDARMTTLGVPLPAQADMRTRGWTSMGSYAFSSTYNPNHPDDAAFVQGVLLPILGVGHATDPAAPRLRRLLFEAHTVSVQDLRRRVEVTDEAVPVKLPIEERAARLSRLKARLPGLVIGGQTEPSHRLVDTLVQQHENGQLKYVPWSACTSKLQEVQGEKVDQVSRGSRDDSSADVTSDLLLMQALNRRSLAYEIAGMCTYDSMEVLTAKLMREYMRPALPQYSRVSLAQMERADRHVFSRCAEITMSGLQMVGGHRPLQEALAQVMMEHEFSYLLMQLPRTATSTARVVADEEMGVAVAPKPKMKVKPPPEPEGLVKKNPKLKQRKTVSRTKDGKALCFGYQKAKGCDKAKDGEACPRGLHLCWVRDCQVAHPGYKHPK